MARGLSRLAALLLLLGATSLLLLSRCRRSDADAQAADADDHGSVYLQLLQQREQENRAEVERLSAEVRALRQRLLQLTAGPLRHLHEDASGSNTSSAGALGQTVCESTVQRHIREAEVTHGVILANEYELIPFNHFTLTRVYPVELGLGRRVVEKPIGLRRHDLSQVINATVNLLTNLTRVQYTAEDFIEGLYRTEPTTGTQYELYFKFRDSVRGRLDPNKDYQKVSAMRPFGPIQVLHVEGPTREKEIIHVILPLSGRTASFQSFMNKFSKIGLRHDRKVFLTVVYFGEEGLGEVRSVMSRARSPGALRLLALNETFSRMKGLRVGARDSRAPLLLLCDVDLVFSARFLSRCRLHAQQGRRVYYPVVFSLYNPHVVYTLQGKPVPPETDQLVINRDTGFWRDTGYGISCQYRSDFWLMSADTPDDISLYRKYVRSNMKVVRASDPGIFHIWHPKVCSKQQSVQDYRSCVRSRALNEASHAQMGLLAFRDAA